MLWNVARRLLTIFAIVLFGGLISAMLVRMAPGFEADERQLDPSLSAESIRALNEAKSGEHNFLTYYGTYLRNAMHGDLGISHALGQPVRSLLSDRWPVTVRVSGFGLLLGWLLAMTMAFAIS